MNAKRITLTQPQIAEVLRRLGKGEKQVAIAKDFGVTRAAISLIKQRTADPGRFKRQHPFKKRLTPDEMAAFKHALEHTRPGDHELDRVGNHPATQWTMSRAIALARRLFDREPSIRVIKECLSERSARHLDDLPVPPQPPVRHDIIRLSPELAADPEFVKYWLSPIAVRIEQRDYERALEIYHRQLAKIQHRRDTTPPPASDGLH